MLDRIRPRALTPPRASLWISQIFQVYNPGRPVTMGGSAARK
jgi:hypothetical protein